MWWILSEVEKNSNDEGCDSSRSAAANRGSCCVLHLEIEEEGDDEG